MNELRRKIVSTSDTLDGLEDNGGNIAADHFLSRRDVITWNEIDFEWFCRKAVPAVRVPGHGRRRRSASVKALRNSEHLLAARGHTGYAQRVFVCFRARVDEKHTVQSVRGNGDKFLRGFSTNIQSHGIALE